MDVANVGRAMKQPHDTNASIDKPRRRRREASWPSAAAAPTWSALLLLLLLHVCVWGAEAGGLWGLGSGSSAGQGVFSGHSAGFDDFDIDDMDEVFASVQQEQFWGEVEHTGMEVLEDEVVEKKTAEIFKRVAKACSVGAQVTLIVGGGALLFRLLPVLLGHELDDEEEAASSPYLLQSTDDAAGGRTQQALPAAAEGGLQRRLTSGLEGPSEDGNETMRSEGGGQGSGEIGGEAAVAEEGGGALVVKADGEGAIVAAGGGGEEQEEGGDGEVVVVNPRRAALRKARRLSRPFLKAMAVPLALLLVARLALGNLLAKTIDPTLELLFSDDVVDLYSDNEKVADQADMPFPKDANMLGRKKMKGRQVQRVPRPEGEGEEEGEGEAGSGEDESFL